MFCFVYEFCACRDRLTALDVVVDPEVLLCGEELNVSRRGLSPL